MDLAGHVRTGSVAFVLALPDGGAEPEQAARSPRRLEPVQRARADGRRRSVHAAGELVSYPPVAAGVRAAAARARVPRVRRRASRTHIAGSRGTACASGRSTRSARSSATKTRVRSARAAPDVHRPPRRPGARHRARRVAPNRPRRVRECTAIRNR